MWWLRRDRKGWTGGETKYETRKGTRGATVWGGRIGDGKGWWEGPDAGFLPVARSIHKGRPFSFVPRVQAVSFFARLAVVYL